MKSLYSSLTKDELIDLVEILNLSLKVEKDTEFKKIIRGLNKLIPFEYAVCAMAETNLEGQFLSFRKVVNASYPEDWLGGYLQHDCAKTDPILNSHFGQFECMRWSEVVRELPRGEMEEYMANAERFGLTHGATSGVFSSARRRGSIFSFAGQDVERDSRSLSLIEQITPYLHLALMRLCLLDDEAMQAALLSPREREILRWMVAGKTNWEISRILGISERTVRFHAGNVFSKLNVSSRSQAVSLALNMGIPTVETQVVKLDFIA